MNLFDDAIRIGARRGSRWGSVMRRPFGMLGAVGLKRAWWDPGSGSIQRQILNSGGGSSLTAAAVAIAEDC